MVWHLSHTGNGSLFWEDGGQEQARSTRGNRRVIPVVGGMLTSCPLRVSYARVGYLVEQRMISPMDRQVYTDRLPAVW